MSKCRVVLAFLIVLALALGVSAYGATSPVAGSFLKQRVSTVPDLVKQVSNDKLVSARYTQHFKMNKPALVAYFQDNLKLSTLRKPTVVSVYFINKAGKIMKGKRLLPTGTAVFMTKTGDPVLDWRCGNPLRAQLPTTVKQIAKKPVTATKAATQTATATAKVVEPVPVKEIVEKVLANPPAEVATLPFATAPAIAAETLAPTVVTAAPAIAPPIVEAVATAPTTAIPPVIAAAGGGFNFLVPAAVLGGLGAAFAGGGGGDRNNPTPPVPEPSGIATLATGMLGMAGLTVRRLRRR